MQDPSILSNTEYRDALREVSDLVDLDPAPGTPEGERLEMLGRSVMAYERRHFPLPPLDPFEAIKFRRDQEGRASE